MKLILLIILSYGAVSVWASDDIFARERLRLKQEISKGSISNVTLGDEIKSAILNSITKTKVGCGIGGEIKRLTENGFEKLNGKKLKIVWMLDRPNGPLAEYTNDGEIALNASTILGLPDGKIHDSKKMIESFLVHEMTHAIVHDLHTRGLFSHYDSGTKMNELLAYKIQGQFIEELEDSGVVYDERRGTPVWDQRSITMVSKLKKLRINQDTDTSKAKEILSDLLLSANTDQEVQQTDKIINFYDFINTSKDQNELWKLTEENTIKVQSTKYLYGLIKEDMSSTKFNKFFSYLRNRIPLYSHYSDLPNGINDNAKDIQDYIKTLDKYLEKVCSQQIVSQEELINKCPGGGASIDINIKDFKAIIKHIKN